MRFELKLAWKYFRARRKSLARFTSLVAIVGIAAGVASLILAQSLARGFADEMRDKILANTAHVSVSMRDGSEIYNWKIVAEVLETLENVAKTSPTILENVVLVGGNSTNYAVLRVIEGQEGFQISNFKFQKVDQHHKIEGEIAKGAESGKHADSENPKRSPSLAQGGQIKELEVSPVNEEKESVKEKIFDIAIGSELAQKSGLKVNDQAELVSFDQEEPKTSKVRISETFQTGLYEYDSTWVSLAPVEYLKLKGISRFTPTILMISVKDIYHTDRTATEIRAKLGDNFKVIDWQEANQPLFAALSLERKFSLAIISLIIFIAALNITTTLSLLVNERRLDIAVLRTCGAKTSNLLGAFLIEGMFLGCTGILIGVIVGILAGAAANYFKMVKLPREVYSLNYIPFNIDFVNVLFIILIAIFLCIAATIYPAFKASRIKPLENLRQQ